MSLGVVMLVHDAFDRAEQVARHWSAAGCPVVIHVDKNVPNAAYDAFAKNLEDVPHIMFCKRHACEWGMWGIVAGTISASELLLKTFADITHVYLASGSCLPLRPVSDLIDYLDRHPRTDFIESATTEDVPWTVGGLDEERFTLYFPFSWRRRRRLFDRWVAFQRRFSIKRQPPKGIRPHMGSQWWCLTRRTLSAILEDPDRDAYDRYWRRVWIPDESYFQSLTRLYSTDVQSRSLTLSKFDHLGKPHVFYDDHLQLLRRSDCFVARKIWPRADRLYAVFLNGTEPGAGHVEPQPSKIDRVFDRAIRLRTQGRPGLYMQSRYPVQEWEDGVTCGKYSVFEGFTDLFEDFEPWLAKATGTRVHGHLFAENWVQFAGREREFQGALTDSAKMRDYDSKAFLTNLIWNTRGEHQCFQFGPWDSQYIHWDLATDPNAQISVITGAWALQLFRSNANFADIRKDAAWRQKIESEHVNALRSQWCKAKVRIWTMTEFMEAPMEHLQTIIEEINPGARSRLTEAPRMYELDGFGKFIQTLKNQGMHPYMLGDYPVEGGLGTTRDAQSRPRKPYLIK